ncbi:hypothetical protein ACN38_g13047, partial [Penicillium nordicum]
MDVDVTCQVFERKSAFKLEKQRWGEKRRR